MNQKTLALGALALALASTAPADDLFGLGTLFGGDDPSEIQVTGVPDAHWAFRADNGGSVTKVENYSPNEDGLGFDNQSRCYGHSLLSTRWFQYITKPLKNGTLSTITPAEFLDFWGGKMDRAINQDITPSNVDHMRLQRFSMYDEASRVAVGKLVGYYHSYQSNLFDHNRTTYDDGDQFRADLQEIIRTKQLPPQLSLRGDDSGHAVNAYKVTEGTATWGNTDGGEGYRAKAWRISIYDPNLPGTGDAADDAGYENRLGLIVFEDAMVGFSEQMEYWYSSFLRQDSAHPEGTWHIPDDQYGIRNDVDDDSNEINSWHWSSISDEEAREIAGLDSAD